MAYKNRSAIQLHNFFKFWNTDVPSIDSLSYQKLDDKVKEAYNVFAAFYQPLNIKALGGSEWGENIYKNTKFLIIQNAVNIYITDKVYYSAEEEDSITVANINRNIKPGDTTHTVWLKRTNGKLSTDAIERFGPDNHWSVRKDSLYKKEKNFKPKINCEGKYPLYLTDHYNTILNSFLGNKSLPLGAGDIMNPARSKGESAVRQKIP